MTKRYCDGCGSALELGIRSTFCPGKPECVDKVRARIAATMTPERTATELAASPVEHLSTVGGPTAERFYGGRYEDSDGVCRPLEKSSAYPERVHGSNSTPRTNSPEEARAIAAWFATNAIYGKTAKDRAERLLKHPAAVDKAALTDWLNRHAKDRASQLPRAFADAPLPCPEAMRHPLIVECPVEAESEYSIRIQTYLVFAGECIRVDPAIANQFDMQAIIVNPVEQTAGHNTESHGGWMPCALFTEWKRYDLQTVTPANQIVWRVRNNHKTSTGMFRAVIFGRVEDEQKKYYGAGQAANRMLTTLASENNHGSHGTKTANTGKADRALFICSKCQLGQCTTLSCSMTMTGLHDWVEKTIPPLPASGIAKPGLYANAGLYKCELCGMTSPRILDHEDSKCGASTIPYHSWVRNK